MGAIGRLPALEADGFNDVEVFGPHATPDGDFPNVPATSPIPKTRTCSTIIIERASEVGADLILASDPDCDRIGLAAPLTLKAGADGPR